MPEPNQNVEELLKAYARKRREQVGAPFEMHPATRNMLKAEAARLAPKPADSKRSWRASLPSLWPRLALSSTLFAALLVVALLALKSLTDPSKEFELTVHDAVRLGDVASAPAVSKTTPLELRPDSASPARSKEEQEATVASVAPLSIAVEAQPNDGATGPTSQLSLIERTLRGAERGTAAGNPVPLGGLDGRGGIVQEGQIAASPPNDAVLRRYGLSPGQPAAGPKAPTDNYSLGKNDTLALKQTSTQEAFGLGLAEKSALAKQTLETPSLPSREPAPQAESKQGLAANQNAAYYFYNQSSLTAANGQRGQVRQRFTQAENLARMGPNLKASSANKGNLLDSFEVKRDGSQVRIIDADGSVYEGNLVEINTPAVEASYDKKVKLESPSQRRVQTDRANLQDEKNKNIAAQEWGSQNILLRAVGTNRSLNQRVEIDGRIFFATNQITPTSRPQSVTAARLQSGSNLPSLQFQGKASIGGSNEIQINAFPVAP